MVVVAAAGARDGQVWQPAAPTSRAARIRTEDCRTLGFLGFVLAYQMLMSPIAVVGYAQELLGLRRRWK